MTRLTKRDAEALIAAIAGDELGPVVAGALGRVLDLGGATPWAGRVNAAADRAAWSPDRRCAVLAEDPDALVDLAIELAELRSLVPADIAGR